MQPLRTAAERAGATLGIACAHAAERADVLAAAGGASTDAYIDCIGATASPTARLLER